MWASESEAAAVYEHALFAGLNDLPDLAWAVELGAGRNIHDGRARRAQPADPHLCTRAVVPNCLGPTAEVDSDDAVELLLGEDRKSTRLNSSHVAISYAVF